MTQLIGNIALIAGAYLLGSFPYILLLSRARGFDLSLEEDFHHSTWHKIGRLEGISGIVVDLLKGAIPVIIGFLLDFSLPVIAGAGIAALTGQMWPVFQKFNGEKGNTTGAGMELTFVSFIGNGALIAFGYCMLCFAIGFLVRTIPRFMIKDQSLSEKLKFGGPVSNSMPLGMLVGFAVTPLAAWYLAQPVELIVALAVAFILIVIRRLTANLKKDLKTPRTSILLILRNRFLFDRSYFTDKF